MISFVVRDALILDGLGGEPVVGDVVVRDGRISDEYAGDLPVIDGDGLYLAPGFIDCHCHDDLAMLRERDRLEKVAQGVTTVVVGNCGFSLFPCTPESKEALQRHAGGLLGKIERSEVFTDFAGYADALRRKGSAINVVSLVGHGPLRLGALSMDDRPATTAERDEMARCLEEQLKQGSAGLSLGLVYPPSAYADRAELVALCETAKRCGKPVAAHIRSYEAGLLDAVDEFLELLRTSGARGVLSHLQAAGRTNWGLVVRALEKLDRATDEGIDIAFDMYPYLAGSSYALQLLPPSASAGGIEKLKARLGEPNYRLELKERLENKGPDETGWQSKAALIGWESILIAGTAIESLKSLEGKTLADAGGEPFDVLERLILEEDGGTAVILFQLSEPDLRAAFTHPLHMVGSDGIPRCDGRPHPRAFGAFPRVLSKLVGEGWFSMGEAVRRMTSEPARRFGLVDRGVIRPGAIADLVLFEPGFRDLATYEEPRRLASGARFVWVGGNAVLVERRTTGALPGVVLPE